MNSKDIREFLVEAKKTTYAGKGAETTSCRPNSHDFIYENGDYMYYDTYLGSCKFAGEEGLWICGNPYWCMNYAGRVLGDNFSGDFLKEALLNVPAETPYRGPQLYVNGDYRYQCAVDGGFEWFQGYETIQYKGKTVYECHFHGGEV